MDEKKWRNLGALLRGNLNWVIALGLFGVGYLFLYFPHWTGDTDKNAPQTAATLVGALWGSAALLFGAQINEWIRRRENKEKIKLEKENINTILLSRFKSIFSDLSSTLSSLEKFLAYMEEHKKTETKWDSPVVIPIEFLSNNFIYSKLFLFDNNCQYLLHFHESVGKTRRDMIYYSEKYGEKLEKPIIIFFTVDLKANFSYAYEIAKNIWPDEHVEMCKKMVNMAPVLQGYLDRTKKLLGEPVAKS